jgi:hypothetical protein
MALTQLHCGSQRGVPWVAGVAARPPAIGNLYRSRGRWFAREMAGCYSPFAVLMRRT